MATYSENSVKHVIVANAADAVTVVDVATGKPVVASGATAAQVNAADVKSFYFNYLNAEGQKVFSDIIEKDKLRKYSKATYKAPTQRAVTIDFVEDVLTPNTEYMLRILIREVMSGSVEDTLNGVASVVTSSSADAATLLKDLTSGFKKDIERMYGVAGKAFNKMDWPVLEVTETATGIVIKEVAPEYKPWILGKVQLTSYNFEVLPSPQATLTATGNTANESFDWVVKKGNLYSSVVGGSLGNGYGKVAADQEFFYHGEIGDVYRGVNYPYNITTMYMIDPAKNYDTIDLSFYFRGVGTSPQASEKQLLLFCAHATSEASGTEGAISLDITEVLDAITA